ncbi:hypothetical protein BX661DRAFT_204631 [Kickxella alabastrina]|uniref:uncharacterized protein n=1 Tax=Kickxella alabastrina TaxID=61397 RepID=UPI00222125CC|nr:uncharacterized protein BX661DRAFT_204631 [Kickxella alabastrina]KAI7831042.1 hypothetical protein BX661DRAFT_204631 [Kickxella alabastrina]
MSCRIKVTNISKHVDKEILSKLFSFLGQVVTLTIRPSVINPEVQEASVDFHDAASAKAALFLSGTELADRALIVASEDPPMITAPITFAHPPVQHPIHPVILSTHAAGTAHAMPLANPAVVAQMAGRPRNLNAIPPLVQALIHPSILQFDPLKAEEISRTVYVGNIAAGVNEQQLMDFFSACGPVAYVKMAGDGMQPTRFAFVEFSEMATAQAALQMNGMMMADRPLKVNHSKNAINKPQRSLGAGLPGVPTLAATASLPSSVDPAAMLAGSAPSSASGGGLAWPVLGTTNPVAADPGWRASIGHRAASRAVPGGCGRRRRRRTGAAAAAAVAGEAAEGTPQRTAMDGAAAATTTIGGPDVTTRMAAAVLRATTGQEPLSASTAAAADKT